MTQGLADTFEPVEYMHRSQHVGGVSTLATFGFEQTLLLEQSEHRLKQALLGTTSKQTGTKVT